MGLMPLSLWRHPRVRGAQGLCVGGRFDPPVDRRQARRVAHRLRAHARRHGLPRTVWVSPLRRCRAVGEVLRAWGWEVRVDEALREVSFGHWEGRPWAALAAADLDAWVADFLDHAPGDGESVRALMARVARVLQARPDGVQFVTHGGWICAAQALLEGRAVKQATDWPSPPAPGGQVLLQLPAGWTPAARSDT